MDVLAMEQIRAADTQIKRSCLIIHPKRGCYSTISGIVCLQSIITRLRNTDRFLVLNLFILEKPFIVIIGFLQDWIDLIRLSIKVNFLSGKRNSFEAGWRMVRKFFFNISLFFVRL